MNHGTSYAYKAGCRCADCAAAYSERRRSWASYNGKRNPGPVITHSSSRPDDGIVDWVVIERLVARDLDWTEATLTERKAAAARSFARGDEDAYLFASEYLHLRSDAIKAVRADLASWLEVAA